jgi:DNA-binding NarL/FixJ family response regulator
MNHNRNPLRILLADDHEVVRRGLRALLESEPTFQVCAEAANGRDAVRKAKEVTPDVAVIDINMPELNGMEAIRRIRKVSPRTQIVILTMFESERLLREAVGCDVKAYILKSDAARDLITAINAVALSRPFFSPAISSILLDHYAKTPRGEPGEQLTGREREILQMLAEGNSNKDIATALSISVKTAETHRGNILRKLGLHSLTELIRYAIRNQIIEP